MSPEIELHHWHAIAAIKSGDLEEAIHHVEHIVGSVTGRHRSVMEDVLTVLTAGDNLHVAEHEIETMLGERASSDLSPDQMHLQLAVYSLETGDLDGVAHHLEHAAEGNPASVLDADDQLSQEFWRSEAGMGLRERLGDAIDLGLSNVDCWLTERPSGSISVEITVALDEGWLSHYAADAFREAAEIVVQANEILSGADISLSVTRLTEWPGRSIADGDAIRLGLAELSAQPGDDLTIVLSGGDALEGSNGLYYRDLSTAVVRHDHGSHTSDSLVLVHEIGHHLGLLHRQGTYMQEEAFPIAPVWSECQS